MSLPKEVVELFERLHCGNNPHTTRKNSTTGDYVLPSVGDAFAGFLTAYEALTAKTAEPSAEQQVEPSQLLPFTDTPEHYKKLADAVVAELSAHDQDRLNPMKIRTVVDITVARCCALQAKTAEPSGLSDEEIDAIFYKAAGYKGALSSRDLIGLRACIAAGRQARAPGMVSDAQPLNWLIEKRGFDVKWLTGDAAIDHGWSADVNRAIRFCRRQDAEGAILRLGLIGIADIGATSHMWISK